MTIVGSGADRTKLIATGGSYGLQISEADSRVKKLRIHIQQTGSTYRGLKLQGDASRLRVTAVDDSDAGGIQMEGFAGETVKLSKSLVEMPLDTDAVGVYGGGAPARLITGCKVKGSAAVRINTTGTEISEIERSVLTGPVGLQQESGGVEVDDVLIKVKPAQPGHAEAGLVAFGNGTSGIAANHVTQIGAEPTGPTDSGSYGVVLAITGTDPFVLMRNSILFGNQVDVQNNDGFASLDYTRWKTSVGDPVSGSNNTDANPRLTAAYRLRPNSPLMDRGEPSGLLPGEPRRDLAGNDRITNGDGRHGPRRDMGAYELQP